MKTLTVKGDTLIISRNAVGNYKLVRGACLLSDWKNRKDFLAALEWMRRTQKLTKYEHFQLQKKLA